jgi:hypothetical protein
MDQLTREQAYFVRRCVGQWLRLKEQWEGFNFGGHGSVHRRYQRGELSQLAADADHSALLVRLLGGGEPLPEPPPLSHAYPVYPDDPWGDQ